METKSGTKFSTFFSAGTVSKAAEGHHTSNQAADGVQIGLRVFPNSISAPFGNRIWQAGHGKTMTDSSRGWQNCDRVK